MLKKAFFGFMAFCAISFGFVSCSNDSDDEESTAIENSSTSTQGENSSSSSQEDVDETEKSSTSTQDEKSSSPSQEDVDETENSQSKVDYSSYYGSYEGTVMNQSVTLTVSESSVDQGENYGAYTKVLWLTDSDGKAVVAAQSDSTNTNKGDLTAENYTTASSCYIVFGTDGSATYYVPAMATMMPNGATFYLVKTYTVDASLSCYVSAMGGVEFGTPIYKSTTITKKADGTVKATLNIGTGTGNIYGVTFVEFVDPRNSTPGYYDADGKVQDATYTVSEDDTATPPSTDEDYETGVNYVTSMTFPVSEDTSEYNLWIYINSNVMGVQFCDGSGSSSSNHPNEATPYIGKLTIDWDSLN